MAAVSLICGKICSGKSTFARKLALEEKEAGSSFAEAYSSFSVFKSIL